MKIMRVWGYVNGERVSALGLDEHFVVKKRVIEYDMAACSLIQHIYALRILNYPALLTIPDTTANPFRPVGCSRSPAGPT